MSEKKIVNSVNTNDVSYRSNKPVSILNRPYLLGFLAFIIFGLLFSTLIYQRLQIYRQTQKKAVFDIANSAKDKLQQSLSYSLSAAKTLSFFINDDGIVKDFDSIASEILQTSKGIDALQLVPGGIIRNVYPLKGNEAVIGYDILKDSTRNKEAFKAIEKKEMFFAGPFQLKQGGIAVVGRLPVFRNDKFWGFSAVIIKISTLLKSAGLDGSVYKGYNFQLSKINPDTGQEEFFIPDNDSLSKSQSVSVNVPDGEWKLSVARVGENTSFGDIILLAVLGFLFSMLGGISIYRFAIRPKKLSDLVEKQTMEMKTSETRYRSLIERVSDAFVSLDKDWNYTYVNQKAGELFAKTPESLIGQNIWKEFPEGIDKPFYHAYYRAMASQTYQYLDEYYEPYDKWFENHIYPSADGLTIFFKDVTEIKQVSLALKENEEKYRSLIEQASDGIVITDLDGIILEANNSIVQMTGFGFEDLLGKHLYSFLPEEDRVLNPLRINELMEGKSLLYERRLLKKNGTMLDVEINSKMATTHTLIGFIRDISERKKAAKELEKSKERFELIARATNDVVWDHDFIKNETWGNKKLYDLYGIEEEKKKIDYEMFINQIHPDDRATVTERMNKAMEQSVSFLSENFRFKMADGEYRNFYDRAHINYDDQGKPVRITGTMQDITESESAKKAILESEEKFRAIIEQALDGIFIADENTRFIEVNSAGCKMLRYSLAELQKIRFLDLIPTEDVTGNPVRITSMEKGGALINERRLIRKDGTFIDVEISARRLLDGRYQSIARDITERKKEAEALVQSENKYRLLFYDNPLPMWMATIPELNIIDVNESAIKKYGYSREEFLKLNAKDMRPAEDVPHFLAEVEKMLPNKNNTRQWVHKKKDGTLINVEIFSHEIVYEGKRVWLGLSQDVTEKYEAKELLQKSYEEIRQLVSNLQNIREEERTKMAREIHDELGQQLTGLKMDLHWLSRKVQNGEEDVNKKIQGSIELINETIATVRKIATDLRPSILDDLGLLAALEWQGYEFEKRSGTKVLFINNAGELKVLPGISTELFRIYQELLTNIARHAKASLVTSSLVVDDKKLYFSIADNGIGFNKDSIANKRTLGLLGIKERTSLIGGTYEINSKPGKGSETIISIPLDIVKQTF